MTTPRRPVGAASSHNVPLGASSARRVSSSFLVPGGLNFQLPETGADLDSFMRSPGSPSIPDVASPHAMDAGSIMSPGEAGRLVASLGPINGLPPGTPSPINAGAHSGPGAFPPPDLVTSPTGGTQFAASPSVPQTSPPSSPSRMRRSQRIISNSGGATIGDILTAHSTSEQSFARLPPTDTVASPVNAGPLDGFSPIRAQQQQVLQQAQQLHAQQQAQMAQLRSTQAARRQAPMTGPPTAMSTPLSPAAAMGTALASAVGGAAPQAGADGTVPRGLMGGTAGDGTVPLGSLGMSGLTHMLMGPGSVPAGVGGTSGLDGLTALAPGATGGQWGGLPQAGFIGSAPHASPRSDGPGGVSFAGSLLSPGDVSAAGGISAVQQQLHALYQHQHELQQLQQRARTPGPPHLSAVSLPHSTAHAPIPSPPAPAPSMAAPGGALPGPTSSAVTDIVASTARLLSSDDDDDAAARWLRKRKRRMAALVAAPRGARGGARAGGTSGDPPGSGDADGWVRAGGYDDILNALGGVGDDDEGDAGCAPDPADGDAPAATADQGEGAAPAGAGKAKRRAPSRRAKDDGGANGRAAGRDASAAQAPPGGRASPRATRAAPVGATRGDAARAAPDFIHACRDPECGSGLRRLPQGDFCVVHMCAACGGWKSAEFNVCGTCGGTGPQGRWRRDGPARRGAASPPRVASPSGGGGPDSFWLDGLRPTFRTRSGRLGRDAPPGAHVSGHTDNGRGRSVSVRDPLPDSDAYRANRRRGAQDPRDGSGTREASQSRHTLVSTAARTATAGAHDDASYGPYRGLSGGIYNSYATVMGADGTPQRLLSRSLSPTSSLRNARRVHNEGPTMMLDFDDPRDSPAGAGRHAHRARAAAAVNGDRDESDESDVTDEDVRTDAVMNAVALFTPSPRGRGRRDASLSRAHSDAAVGGAYPVDGWRARGRSYDASRGASVDDADASLRWHGQGGGGGGYTAGGRADAPQSMRHHAAHMGPADAGPRMGRTTCRVRRCATGARLVGNSGLCGGHFCPGCGLRKSQAADVCPECRAAGMAPVDAALRSMRGPWVGADGAVEGHMPSTAVITAPRPNGDAVVAYGGADGTPLLVAPPRRTHTSRDPYADAPPSPHAASGPGPAVPPPALQAARERTVDAAIDAAVSAAVADAASAALAAHAACARRGLSDEQATSLIAAFRAADVASSGTGLISGGVAVDVVRQLFPTHHGLRSAAEDAVRPRGRGARTLSMEDFVERVADVVARAGAAADADRGAPDGAPRPPLRTPRAASRDARQPVESHGLHVTAEPSGSLIWGNSPSFANHRLPPSGQAPWGSSAESIGSPHALPASSAASRPDRLRPHMLSGDAISPHVSDTDLLSAIPKVQRGVLEAMIAGGSPKNSSKQFTCAFCGGLRRAGQTHCGCLGDDGPLV